MTSTGVKDRRTQLLSTPEVAELLGISSDAAMRLLRAKSIAPEDSYQNPHCRSGPLCPLWPPEAIQGLVGSNEVLAIHERARNRVGSQERKRQERVQKFGQKYADWKYAIPEAAECMFSLNRYAKHDSCTETNKEEIYKLKNGFVALLYRLNMAIEVRRHEQFLPELICRRCGGTGAGSYSDAGECSKCDGSGIYLPETTRVFIAFLFLVGGKRYAWHQPKEHVSFSFTETVSSSGWEPERVEKPVPLGARKFKEAKELIGWVLRESRKK